jgi:lactoylglutathione lyase
MSEAVVFENVYPIGDTRTDALPVKALGPAIGYYAHVLGFSLVEKQENRATLRRDAVTIGLEKNTDDPEQASCYFAVRGVDALREELAARGIEPSPLRLDTNAGKQYRVFFAKEPYGVCFCFGQPAT